MISKFFISRKSIKNSAEFYLYFNPKPLVRKQQYIYIYSTITNPVMGYPAAKNHNTHLIRKFQPPTQ